MWKWVEHCCWGRVLRCELGQRRCSCCCTWLWFLTSMQLLAVLMMKYKDVDQWLYILYSFTAVFLMATFGANVVSGSVKHACSSSWFSWDLHVSLSPLHSFAIVVQKARRVPCIGCPKSFCAGGMVCIIEVESLGHLYDSFRWFDCDLSLLITLWDKMMCLKIHLIFKKALDVNRALGVTWLLHCDRKHWGVLWWGKGWWCCPCEWCRTSNQQWWRSCALHLYT